METSLRQRLVGAVVLIALGVIFIPMVLDGSGRSARVNLDLALPPEPIYSPPDRLPELPEPAAGPIDAPEAAPGEPVAEQAEPRPVAKAVPADRANAEPAREPTPSVPAGAVPPPPQAWVVQVGAFGEERNAEALRDRLRKAGFAAFVETVRGEGKRVYRVKVGPELERAKAEALQARLAKEHQLDGLVVSQP